MQAQLFLLACLAFVLASAGSAMLVLGGQLLDRVDVSSRWTRQPLDFQEDVARRR
ncbi:hypothetical protein BH10PSE15_BH10PSE15_18040 [soil metagenome]